MPLVNRSKQYNAVAQLLLVFLMHKPLRPSWGNTQKQTYSLPPDKLKGVHMRWLRKEFVNSPVLALCVWDRVCVWGRHPLSCMHDPQNITSHCNRGPKHSHPLLPWHTTATQHILARQNTYQARNVYMMWDDVSGKDFHCGRVCCTAKHQNNVFSLEINNYHHIRRLKSWNKIPNASFFSALLPTNKVASFFSKQLTKNPTRE